MAKVRVHVNEPLDLVCWRHYGRTSGAVEMVLAANPILRHMPVLLPAGMVLEMPVAPPPPLPKLQRLWD